MTKTEEKEREGKREKSIRNRRKMSLRSIASFALMFNPEGRIDGGFCTVGEIKGALECVYLVQFFATL